MPKLKLDLDQLVVDSFSTEKPQPRAGTVFGEQCTCYTNCTCPGCPTCDASCNGTCGGTCAASCYGTCGDFTCGNSCNCGTQYDATCNNYGTCNGGWDCPIVP